MRLLLLTFLICLGVKAQPTGYFDYQKVNNLDQSLNLIFLSERRDADYRILRNLTKEIAKNWRGAIGEKARPFQPVELILSDKAPTMSRSRNYRIIFLRSHLKERSIYDLVHSIVEALAHRSFSLEEKDLAKKKRLNWLIQAVTYRFVKPQLWGKGHGAQSFRLIDDFQMVRKLEGRHIQLKLKDVLESDYKEDSFWLSYVQGEYSYLILRALKKKLRKSSNLKMFTDHSLSAGNTESQILRMLSIGGSIDDGENWYREQIRNFSYNSFNPLPVKVARQEILSALQIFASVTNENGESSVQKLDLLALSYEEEYLKKSQGLITVQNNLKKLLLNYPYKVRLAVLEFFRVFPYFSVKQKEEFRLRYPKALVKLKADLDLAENRGLYFKSLRSAEVQRMDLMMLSEVERNYRHRLETSFPELYDYLIELEERLEKVDLTLN